MSAIKGQLAREIASAIFRVSAIVKHDGLKNALENVAISLASDFSLVVINKAEALILFSETISEIKPVNVRVLIRELSNLKKMIKEDELEIKEVDLSNFFNKDNVYLKEEVSSDKKETGYVASFSSGALKRDAQNRDSYGRVGRRASVDADKILQFIKDKGQSRLKELEANFREVSGRTVRRATELLIREGKIERVGNPGPSSYYRPKSSSNNLEETRTPINNTFTNELPREIGNFQRIAPNSPFVRLSQGE